MPLHLKAVLKHMKEKKEEEEEGESDVFSNRVQYLMPWSNAGACYQKIAC